MRWLLNRLRNHFECYRHMAPWPFAWRIGVESVLVSFAIIIPFAFLIEIGEREFQKWPPAVLFVVVVFIAPIFETILFQAIPILAARLLRARFRTQILISTILFAAVHFPEGILVGFAAGVIGGLYFAFAFAHWAERSYITALWVTMAAHSIHNLLPAIISMFS